MARFREYATYGEMLGRAMEITDPGEARLYFEDLVEYSMSCVGRSREQAESIQRYNLAYYAGYYDNETRERVERLFSCEHPVLGSIAKDGPPTTEQAFWAGVEMATGGKKKPKRVLRGKRKDECPTM